MIMTKPAGLNVCWSAVVIVLSLTLGACQAAGVGSEARSSPTQAAAAVDAEQAQQVRRLESLLKRPSSDLPSSTDANGRQSVSLQSGFRNVVMVEKNPDGSHSIICTDSLDRATEFFAGGSRNTLEEQ